MNQEIKINLTKLPGALVHDLTGRSGTKKKCLIIPMDESGLYTADGSVYLKCIGQELTNQKGQSHMIKQYIEPEQYNALTEADRNKLPVIGGIKEFGKKKTE